MTLQEVCEKYNVAESTMKNAFPRTAARIYKSTGIKLIKEGRGELAQYRESIDTDGRAKTMYDEKEKIRDEGIIRSDLNILDFDFMVFLAIITTPMLVFRGSYQDFLKYIDVRVNEDNIERLNKALEWLDENELIYYALDFSTKEDYFTASLRRKVEVEMKIGIGMIRDCQTLAEKNNKRDWVPLLKVWIGTEFLSKDGNLFTLQELSNVTGLTRFQVQSCGKILKNSNIYKTTRAYNGLNRCSGMRADLNREEFYRI